MAGERTWRRLGASLGISGELALTLLIGALGVALARRYSIPGGALTGALAATALGRLFGAPLCEPPKWLRSLARIFLGLTIGVSVGPATLQAIAEAWLPILLIVFSVIAVSLGAAWAANRLARMPLTTALCGATPGMTTAMIALADDLDADSRIVASMHLVRLVSVLSTLPFLVHVLLSAHGGVGTIPVATAGRSEPWRLVFLVAAGLIASMGAVRLKLPAGEILAGLLVAAVLNATWLDLAQVPATWRLFAQWVVGAGVGATVTRAALRDFRPFAVAGGLMTALLIASALALGWLLAQVTSLDLATCIAGTAPGGADQMILLAGELGADSQLVATMHIARQIILLLLLPAVIRIISGAQREA